MSVLWKSYFGHFGECAVEKLLWATQALASVLWKSYFGLLRAHFGECAVEKQFWATQDFGECAVEELSWATQGSLWGVCCGGATLGYTQGSLCQCALEELSWATGRTEVQSSKNLTTPQSYGWGKNKTKKLESLKEKYFQECSDLGAAPPKPTPAPAQPKAAPSAAPKAPPGKKPSTLGDGGMGGCPDFFRYR